MEYNMGGDGIEKVFLTDFCPEYRLRPERLHISFGDILDLLFFIAIGMEAQSQS